MRLDLAGIDNGAVRGTEAEEESIERVREGFGKGEENGGGFSDSTGFEVSEDCFDDSVGGGLRVWVKVLLVEELLQYRSCTHTHTTPLSLMPLPTPLLQ